MNQFKFRAWYKPHLDKGVVEKFEQVEINYELFFVSSKDKDVKYKFDIPFMDDDWIVEPSIGLKDKNGVEIYKGDIVIYDFTRYVTKEPVTGIVEYKTECASYGIVPLAYRDSIELFGDLALNAPLEVVGNVHDRNKEEIK